MIEKEVKIMLTEIEYDLMCNMFEHNKIIDQYNNYYASDKGLRLDATIRIREKDARYYLQIKMPISCVGSLSVKREFCKEVDSIYEIIKGDVCKELTGIDFGDCKLIGKLSTERRIKYINDEVEICIDKNTYLGKTDYEIEIEYTGNYPHDLVNLLKENGIICDAKLEGKYKRFKNALREKEEISHSMV